MTHERIINEEHATADGMTPAARRVHEEYVTEPTVVRRGGIWGWLVAALCAAVAIAAVVWALTRGPDTVHVPGVVGSSQIAARAALQAKGLNVDVIAVSSPKAEGSVLRQAPHADAVLGKGDTVALITSAGPPKIKIPAIAGLKAQGATRILSSLKLTPQPTVVPSNKPKGTVLDQLLGPGSRVAKGTQVGFTVSRGPTLVVVPALRGLSEQKAVAALRRQGFSPKLRQVVSPEPAGTIVAQSPVRGTKLKPGAQITMNVSRGTGLVDVPALRGLSQQKAQAALAAAGLKPRIVTVSSADPAGTVVAQSPARGAQLKKGAIVRMNVSDGKGAKKS